jgi:hypothetical protein
MALTENEKRLLSEVIGELSEFNESVSGSSDPVAQILRMRLLNITWSRLLKLSLGMGLLLQAITALVTITNFKL